jgi:DNA-binding GntR family transcriptional regulator
VKRPSPVPTLTDWAIEEVRRRIVLGDLPPGERLPLEELANELGISRVPLREAVRSLEAEGLVATTPHRGAVTTPLNLDNAQDAYALLEAAEMLAVERATAASNPESLARMEASLGAMREHIHDAHLTRESLEAHRAFHFAFFDLVGEGVLLRHLRVFWNTCERYVMASIPDGDHAAHAYEDHEELVRLVREGDAEAAKDLLRNHLRNSFEAVKDRLATEGQGNGDGRREQLPQ